MSDSDRDLLNRVRQAGLWEMPSGDMARVRAQTPQVRDVGQTLMVDHGRLDVQVRQLAAKYGVVLPDQATADQQSWLAEERAATTTSDFERVFVNRLRAAHGVIFAVIAQVRAGTRNDDIRAFAATANQVVLRHISLLESTGLVDYNALPQPTVSSTAATSAASALNLGSMDIATSVALGLLVCGATLLVLWLIRNSARRRHRSGENHARDRDPEPAKEPVR
ncbi:DUF4142 domain-containing protein [Amycolatopsis pithecellobii]|uniref:DUF4142 domain-containing protein n=1 Tax=Amycolatopsis pithecellobii TaxID=664692 RepID=UPI0028B10292|nr:DUF4142 domain-containing protein [Amycolatopsis pithecellobii]